MATTGTVWAFDLGEGSIGEFPSPRWGEGGRRPDELNTHIVVNLLYKASLLIPAEFAKNKTGEPFDQNSTPSHRAVKPQPNRRAAPSTAEAAKVLAKAAKKARLGVPRRQPLLGV